MDTKLVEQARRLGFSEPNLIAITSADEAFKAGSNKQIKGSMASTARRMVPGLPEDSDADEFMTKLKKRTGGAKYGLEGTDQLRLVRKNIEEDVVGIRPLSGINHMWIALQVMLMWNQIKGDLAANRNPF